MLSNRTMTTWFWQLPRSARWLAFTVIFTVLFFAWHSLCGSLIDEWNTAADDIESQVAAIRGSSAIANDLRRDRDAVIAIGDVSLPGGEKDGRDAMSEAVTQVMGDLKYSYSLSGSGGRLPQDISRKIVRGSWRLSRLTCELKFDATPADAIQIVSAFEAHPDIEAVSSVRLKKTSDGKVTVRLGLESWVETTSRLGGR